MKRLTGFAICLLVPAFFGGCSTGDATLFVDNDSDESVIVEIDGKHALWIGSDRYSKCRVRYGEHRVVVRQKDKVIFDQTKIFEPHADGPRWRHYILDPHADTRYVVREVYYYADGTSAKNMKPTRKIKSLSRTHWVDVPKSASAIESMPFVVTSDVGESTTRQYVIADK